MLNRIFGRAHGKSFKLGWIPIIFYVATHGTVIADFTTHGESHFYGLPCPSADSLYPMDHFFSFDVSKIIPKNMKKLPYTTFKPFLVYIRGFDP